MDTLKGKVAFITGSGSGIGRAAAVLFTRESARVAVADISRAGGEETVRMAREAGGDAVYVETDVTDPVSAERAIKSVADRWGRLDVLYNNAGGSMAQDGRVTEVSIEEWWRAQRLDLFGTFLCCRFGIPELIRAGGGSVINTTSVVALCGVVGRDAYTAAQRRRRVADPFAGGRIRQARYPGKRTGAGRHAYRASQKIRGWRSTHRRKTSARRGRARRRSSNGAVPRLRGVTPDHWHNRTG
jgi:NAD(P)-dependent dehydrogenase (short-subunit alcohol dehydrogenase family)